MSLAGIIPGEAVSFFIKKPVDYYRQVFYKSALRSKARNLSRISDRQKSEKLIWNRIIDARMKPFRIVI